MKTAEEILKEHTDVDEENQMVASYVHIILSAMELYASQFQQPTQEKEQWVSIKDRLPKECEEVLVYNNYGRVFQKSWMEFTDQDESWFIKNFTHWMPLPKPPQTKQP